MNRVKEKLDKCVKEKLVEFCDVLDVPISKANTRKVCLFVSLRMQICLCVCRMNAAVSVIGNIDSRLITHFSI